MKDKDKLVEKVLADKISLENKIESNKTNEFKNISLKLLIKSGMVLDYALPYILAALFAMNTPAFKENKPIVIDKINVYAQIETIDTSSGFHIKKSTYDYKFDKDFLEYSTGWKINDEGLYEREVTSYKISDDIDLTDTEKILSMSKEEIESILEISNIQKVKSSSLIPEDYIYNSDCLIVSNHYESEDDFIIRNETIGQNVINSIYYILVTIGWGFIFTDVKKIFFKDRFSENLKYYKESLRPIKPEDLKKFKEVLKIKEENLKMLDSESKSLNNKGYTLKK